MQRKCSWLFESPMAGPRKGPPGRDSGGMARPGAGVAGFPARGGGAPRHGRGGQHLAAPALRAALGHWRYRPRNPPPPQPQPPHKRRRR